MDDGTNRAERDNGITTQRPVIVSVLYLVNFMLGITIFIGVVLAYVWRADEDALEWEKTHFTYLIRTFWIAFVIGILLIAGMFGSFFSMMDFAEAGSNGPPPGGFFAGFFAWMGGLMLLSIWVAVRSVVSLAKAGSRKPIANPGTWLF